MSDDRILAELAAMRADFTTRMDRLDGRSERLESRMERLESRMELLEGRMERLDGRMERLEANQNKIRGEIMARIDRLSDVVSGIREDIRVNFGATEAIRRVNEHTHEELRDWQDIVADLRRQMMSLSERVAALELRS